MQRTRLDELIAGVNHAAATVAILERNAKLAMPMFEARAAYVRTMAPLVMGLEKWAATMAVIFPPVKEEETDDGER